MVEDVVDRFELRLRYGPSFERPTAKPLVLMTQRRHLDAFLVEQATAAGANFRDGVTVRRVEVENGGVAVDVSGRRLHAHAVVAADGANGVTARSLDLNARPVYGVALEGNLPYAEIDPRRYRGRAVLEIGSVPGGYGWVFPKGDHVNFGVGGWEREGPKLREHLRRLCRQHGVSEDRLEAVRGHRLPMGRPDEAVLARGRALAVGDAAALVDPFSGDGMYEAFLSATLAAEATLDLLAGRTSGLEPYDVEIKRSLGQHMSSSWAAKLALERFPLLVFTLVRSRYVRRAIERLLRSDPHPAGTRELLRASLKVLAVLPLAAPRPTS